jgi:hypothetical protein
VNLTGDEGGAGVEEREDQKPESIPLLLSSTVSAGEEDERCQPRSEMEDYVDGSHGQDRERVHERERRRRGQRWHDVWVHVLVDVRGGLKGSLGFSGK